VVSAVVLTLVALVTLVATLHLKVAMAEVLGVLAEVDLLEVAEVEKQAVAELVR
jgi:hypothetical protein